MWCQISINRDDTLVSSGGVIFSDRYELYIYVLGVSCDIIHLMHDNKIIKMQYFHMNNKIME